MQTDFYDAHQRHWDDAERLFGASRWANADHLYGITAECGLKRLMLAFGMQTGVHGVPQEQHDRKHIEQIWVRYETYRSGHVAGFRYGLPPNNPFDDWNASQRYAHQSEFEQARVTPHRTGADVVRTLVKKAALEGLL
ncbi:SAM-dependent methyltransferase [Candidatus Viridilinea mediisalina]|uniref:SAM-dependent methyltransferase n=1 Tax=Candidatus Viridilinea mediisalina TaxID=2024553 RepID=A0A2A6RHB7_9CHLR|nr:SAM-dependent methyltransferase [Candidatus Viridilinea mediisalina]PDW02514.1 SAM-dependent methyltransferase [Candidatus Viridilinea mediisalina]